MIYVGSKLRIAKYILPIILKDRQKDQYYVEPFVGGCNLIDKVSGLRIGGDINKYLIALFIALQQGWSPPTEVTLKHYEKVRSSYNSNTNEFTDFYKGYIGFACSFRGKFFGGFAHSTSQRDYCYEHYKALFRQILKLRDVKFYCCAYQFLPIPNNSIIYCDIPYKNTEKYRTFDFNYDRFWDWCKTKVSEGHQVFISSVNAPSDFQCVWEQVVTHHLGSRGFANSKQAVERLFTVKDGYDG